MSLLLMLQICARRGTFTHLVGTFDSYLISTLAMNRSLWHGLVLNWGFQCGAMHNNHDDHDEGNSQGTLPSQLVYIERKIMSVVFIAIKVKL
jgi:hypothetical protein